MESTAITVLRVLLSEITLVRQIAFVCCSETIPVLVGRSTGRFSFAVLSPKAAYDVTHLICIKAEIYRM